VLTTSLVAGPDLASQQALHLQQIGAVSDSARYAPYAHASGGSPASRAALRRPARQGPRKAPATGQARVQWANWKGPMGRRELPTVPPEAGYQARP
jgi:hypothetical protein